RATKAEHEPHRADDEQHHGRVKRDARERPDQHADHRRAQQRKAHERAKRHVAAKAIDGIFGGDHCSHLIRAGDPFVSPAPSGVIAGHSAAGARLVSPSLANRRTQEDTSVASTVTPITIHVTGAGAAGYFSASVATSGYLRCSSSAGESSVALPYASWASSVLPSESYALVTSAHASATRCPSCWRRMGGWGWNSSIAWAG